MSTQFVGQFKDSILIHFGSESPRINAYTVTGFLAGVVDSVKAANTVLNPSCDLEVETFWRVGSQAEIRMIYRPKVGASSSTFRRNILGIVISSLYQRTISSDENTTIKVGTGDTLIRFRDNQIVIPREIRSAAWLAKKHPGFNAGIERIVSVVDSDGRIADIGFSDGMAEKDLPIKIPREFFAVLTVPPAKDNNRGEDISESIKKILLSPLYASLMPFFSLLRVVFYVLGRTIFPRFMTTDLGRSAIASICLEVVLYSVGYIFLQVRHYVATRRSLRKLLGLYLNVAFAFATLYMLLLAFAPVDGPPFRGIHNVWPESRHDFTSVVDNLWLSLTDCLHYSIVTITTLGYGDMTPLTWYAKLLTDTEVLIGLALLTVGIAQYFFLLGDNARRASTGRDA